MQKTAEGPGRVCGKPPLAGFWGRSPKKCLKFQPF